MASNRRRVVLKLLIVTLYSLIELSESLPRDIPSRIPSAGKVQNDDTLFRPKLSKLNNGGSDVGFGKQNLNLDNAVVGNRFGKINDFKRIKDDSPKSSNALKFPAGEHTKNGKIFSKNKAVQQMKISETSECQDDVLKYCHGSKNNFAVLDCLQSDLKMEDDVSVACQHLLYQYKRNLTKDDRFHMASQGVCNEDLKKITECSDVQLENKGFVIPCLIENIENVTNKNCKQYLSKMSTIVFSDYRRVYKFIENCQEDIDNYKCGRVTDKIVNEELLHNQGSTIDCLAEKMAKKREDALKPKCKHQLVRVLEQQSDDYHLDRQLYYACQEDREQFCADTRSGGGKIYKCLYQHISSTSMSTKCRKRLEFRQRLIAQDVKIDKTFYNACKKDIKKNRCATHDNNDDPELQRATVLLCLETKVKEDVSISSDCINEMKLVRKNIMEDFNVDPNILVGCQDELQNECADKGVGGQTIHCLMALIESKEKKGLPVNVPCKVALQDLLETADVGSDYAMDKVLTKACKPVIQKVCDDEEEDGSIMNCLMDNLDHDEMTGECEDRLLEIQYFIVRDFRLDNHLYKACKKDAKSLCHMEGNWFDPKNERPETDPMVLPCLYQHLKDRSKKLSRGCRHEVKRVMRQRAKSVDLEPEIEEKCIHDLAQLCSDQGDLDHGEEINCLQDHYDDLRAGCKEAIGNFTEEEDSNYEMDNRIMKACTPMIKAFCNELLEGEADPSDILECLIEHKNNEKMNHMCAAGIEHHQITTLKDFRFSHKFKESCQSDVAKYCKNKKTKYEVVTCLSEIVRSDTLLSQEHRLAKKCRRQLKFELLQREESIDLDPKLKEACHKEISEFCNKKKGNAYTLECLKENKKHLEASCHALIFKRQKDEIAIADYGIATVCKHMIKKFCEDLDEESDILHCLKENKDNPQFESNCRIVVLRRQIAQTNDYRLNPRLRAGCHADIPKFCSDIISKEKNDEELQGKVINCLKQKFRLKRLSKDCAHEIEFFVKEAAVNINLAPQLAHTCSSEIQKHCSQKFDDNGDIQECLKDHFKDIKDINCKREVAYLVQESRIDINVDPVLNGACVQDIQNMCHGIDIGEGKIMSCLLSALEDSPKKLTAKCYRQLLSRKQVWEYAAQVAPPESLKEVYESLSQSPAKGYFLGILVAVVAVIFIIGITCGRVTKRVRAELKNR